MAKYAPKTSPSLVAQKKMNIALARQNYTLAFEYYKKVNALRPEEGLELLHLPNLEKRFATT